VRELEPYNKQATTALNRCLKYIEQETGEKYEPERDDVQLPAMDGIRTAEEQI